jgi:hypothetical protein
VAVDAAGRLMVDYREDDGALLRAVSLLQFFVRHPLRSALDAIRRSRGEPKLSALAPAVRRMERDRAARVHALGTEQARTIARRMAALAGRPLE